MQPTDDPPADGLQPQPSTRRVPSGSPAGPSGIVGEPNLSPPDATDAIFDALKDRISRLWDEGASADAIKSALTDT